MGDDTINSPEQKLSVSARMRGLSAQWVACWITICYAVGSSLYVIVTGRLLTYLVTDPEKIREFDTYKTLLLIAVSSVVVFELAKRTLRLQANPRVRPRGDALTRASSLRAQINLLILSVALPLVALLGYLIYAQAHQDAETARQSVRSTARIAATDTERFIAIARNKIGIVAKRIEARPSLEPCDPAFDYFAWLNPEFTVLLLWTPDGRVICPFARSSVRYGDAARPPWLAQTIAERRPLVSEPYRGPLSGQWITVLSYPVQDAGGAIRGVLDLSIDLGSFAPVAAPVGADAQALRILDGKGRLAAGGGTTLQPGEMDGAVSALASAQRDGYAVSMGADNIERIYGFAPIAGTDWVAVAGVPVDRVFKNVNEALVRTTLLALAIVFAVSYAAYRVSLRIERPIIIAARTAQSIADGNTDVRVPVIGPAETQVVARQLNVMLDGRVETERQLAELLDEERRLRVEAERARAELAALRDGLENQVAVRTEELLERNRDMETFAYAIAHDLSAPLRRIDGFSRLLVVDHGASLGASASEQVTRIRDSIKSMGEMIDGLLQLAKVTHIDLKCAPVDLTATAREIVAELRRGDPARLVTVSIAEGMVADVDRNLIRVVLTNLLENAWKYGAHRENAHICVDCQIAADGAAIYRVSDDGAGFDMKFADKLFAPFQRMHTQEQFSGIGIGLATVKRAIVRHRGRIWAESAPDRGTTIYFTLGPPV